MITADSSMTLLLLLTPVYCLFGKMLVFLGSPVARCAKHAVGFCSFNILCVFPGSASPADALLQVGRCSWLRLGMHTHSLRTRLPGAWVRRELVNSPSLLLYQKRLHPVKRASHKHDRKTAWKTTVMPARAQRKRTWMAVLFCKAQETICHACEELRTGVQKKKPGSCTSAMIAFSVKVTRNCSHQR